MTPLWLLDVDGVINALNPKNKHVRAWGGYASARVGFQIRYSPVLISRITGVVESDQAEIRWLTTWEREANTIPVPALGLPQLQVVSRAGHYGEGWWKLSAAQGVAGEHPLIWTDDDILQHYRAKQWLRAREAPTLGIAPSRRGGLQPQEMDLIEQFVRAYATETLPGTGGRTPPTP